jgi:hypothetical protein
VASNVYGSVTNAGTALTVLRTIPFFVPGSPGMRPNGNFALTLGNLSGHGPVILSGSSDFVNWVPLWTNPAVLGSLMFTDSVATHSPVKFYQAVEQ